MIDPRNTKLARFIIDKAVSAKKGDNILLRLTDPLGSPLAKEVYKYGVLKQSNIHVDTWLPDTGKFFYDHASKEMLERKPEITEFLIGWCDKVVTIVADSNSRDLSEVDPKKVIIRQKVSRPIMDKLLKKTWTLLYYPTHSMAQESNMSLEDLEDFYFNACLQDYSSIHKKLEKMKKILDNTKEIHVVGNQTDLKMSFRKRYFVPDTRQFNNIPAGEVFGAPLENSVDGYIYYEFPSIRMNKEVKGIRLWFKKGKVIKFSAEKGEDTLKASLDIDPGARRVGEFSIAANYGIKRFMNNTLFDEKIGGTIHTALGKAYEGKEGGGKNRSAIHWDIVKDMGSGISGENTKGSKIVVDGKVVLVDGRIII
ncbi:aminopeptidase [Candidatus Dojkabacteria bacterium]|nr:aminopeptidase [Candidatus Dojkabacteria bacterium]